MEYHFRISIGSEIITDRMLTAEKAELLARALGLAWPSASATMIKGGVRFTMDQRQPAKA